MHGAADGVDQLRAPTQPKNGGAHARDARAPHAGTAPPARRARAGGQQPRQPRPGVSRPAYTATISGLSPPPPPSHAEVRWLLCSRPRRCRAEKKEQAEKQSKPSSLPSGWALSLQFPGGSRARRRAPAPASRHPRLIAPTGSCRGRSELSGKRGPGTSQPDTRRTALRRPIWPSAAVESRSTAPDEAGKNISCNLRMYQPQAL